MNSALNLEILSGAVDVIQLQEFKDKLNKGKTLRIKAGFDPSCPDLHLGHLILLKKLRWFQDQGHQVIFIVGDFTAQIGDPSGVNQTRPVLTLKEVKKNAKTYAKQAYRILNKKRSKIVYNSKWLKPMKSSDLVRLASCSTVARMLERNDFSSRFKEQKSIGLHEFLYPLLQGYDSFELQSDVEIGGTDQLFNLLMGREIQKQYKQEPQCVFTFPLIEGTDGVQKMSKSYGNAIAFNDSTKDIFGKTMKISDELMLEYYKAFLSCLTSSKEDQKFKQKSLSISQFFEELESSSGEKVIPKIKDISTPLSEFIKGASSHTSLKEILIHKIKEEGSSLKFLKENLAFYFVETLYSFSEAKKAQKEFNEVFKENLIPVSIKEVKISEVKEIALSSLMKQIQLCTSTSEARRSIEGGGVKLLEGNCVSDDRLKKYIGKKVQDSQLRLDLKRGDEFILSVGKRKQVRVKVRG